MNSRCEVLLDHNLPLARASCESGAYFCFHGFKGDKEKVGIREGWKIFSKISSCWNILFHLSQPVSTELLLGRVLGPGREREAPCLSSGLEWKTALNQEEQGLTPGSPMSHASALTTRWERRSPPLPLKNMWKVLFSFQGRTKTN